jgi:hypothetical protein
MIIRASSSKQPKSATGGKWASNSGSLAIVHDELSGEAKPGRWGRRVRPWLVIVGFFVLWVVDGVYRGSLADAALDRAGYGERVTGRNLAPKLCGILDYEAVFWGQGPRAPEAQGYVCVGHFRAPEILTVSFDQPMGIDIHG